MGSRRQRAALNGSLETVLAVLLGLVAVGIAYASFQAALYDGKVISANTLGTNQATEAQALYLEGNQQWVQDAQLFDTLNLLALDTDNSDPAIAQAAQIKYDTIYFQSVSDEFDAAITWAAEQNEADPDLWYSPLDSEDYQDFLYSSYDEKKAESDATLAAAAAADQHGDRHMLNTVAHGARAVPVRSRRRSEGLPGEAHPRRRRGGDLRGRGRPDGDDPLPVAVAAIWRMRPRR